MILQAIQFYKVNEKYGEFSNFATFPIQLKNQEWPTSEHYFQGQKFADTPHEQEIRAAESPMAAASMGRDPHRPLRSDWDAVKDQIMRDAVLAKFQQHPKLSSLLLSTSDLEIIEHTRNDSYWGDGGDGSGLNRLGQILMETRLQLRQQHITRTFDLSAYESEVAFRPMQFTLHEYHGEDCPMHGSLLSMLHNITYLINIGVLPPFDILNEILKEGGSTGGMSDGTTWSPFELTVKEYDALAQAAVKVPGEALQSPRSPVLRTGFKIDRSLDHMKDYMKWLDAVYVKRK